MGQLVGSKFRNFLRDPEKKTYPEILMDLIKCVWFEKELPRHYFFNFLYKKGGDDFRDYIGARKAIRLQHSSLFHPNSTTVITRNKLFSHYYFPSYKIPMPLLIGHNVRDCIILGDEKKSARDFDSFKGCVDLALEKARGEPLFFKPKEGTHGKGCFMIKKEDLDSGKLKDSYKKILKTDYIIEETVEQHPKLDELNKSCLNTIRLDTFIDNNGEIHPITARLRLGREGRVVDNVSRGGIYVGVDLDTGKLVERGQSILVYDTKYYFEHPDTQKRFAGFEIPYFEQVIELAKQAADCLQNRLIGWDIGISKDGPLLLEGNSRYGIIAQQVLGGGYRRHKVFQKVLEEEGIKNPRPQKKNSSEEIIE